MRLKEVLEKSALGVFAISLIAGSIFFTVLQQTAYAEEDGDPVKSALDSVRKAADDLAGQAKELLDQAAQLMANDQVEEGQEKKEEGEEKQEKSEKGKGMVDGAPGE